MTSVRGAVCSEVLAGMTTTLLPNARVVTLNTEEAPVTLPLSVSSLTVAFLYIHRLVFLPRTLSCAIR